MYHAKFIFILLEDKKMQYVDLGSFNLSWPLNALKNEKIKATQRTSLLDPIFDKLKVQHHCSPGHRRIHFRTQTTAFSCDLPNKYYIYNIYSILNILNLEYINFILYKVITEICVD